MGNRELEKIPVGFWGVQIQLGLPLTAGSVAMEGNQLPIPIAIPQVFAVFKTGPFQLQGPGSASPPVRRGLPITPLARSFC